MKEQKYAVALGSVFAMTMATPGFAQMKEFTGASIYGSTGYNTSSSEISDIKYNSTYSFTSDNANLAGSPLFLGLDYTWAMSDSNSLGLSIERNFLKSASGTTNFYYGGSYIGGASSVVDNSYQISILPGFLIDKSSLVYGKLGYYSAGVTVSGDTWSDSLIQTGYSIGAGLKRVFPAPSGGNSLYIFGESNYRIANSVSQTFDSGSVSANVKLGGMNVLVGVGMKF